jgi:predicted MFS family arabinose efflux permease
MVTGYLANLFGGMRITASSSLTLEQVPKFRGTMMSINSAADGMGAALGAGIGGWGILLSGYEFAGWVLGSLGIISAAVFQVLAADPTRS